MIRSTHGYTVHQLYAFAAIELTPADSSYGK